MALEELSPDLVLFLLALLEELKLDVGGWRGLSELVTESTDVEQGLNPLAGSVAVDLRERAFQPS
jgi:hypothetical protein